MLVLNIILSAIVFAGIVALLARAIRSSATHDAAVVTAAPTATPRTTAAAADHAPRRRRGFTPAEA